MPNLISLTPRDEALLKLLARTPATSSLLFKAAETFPGDPFGDERRVRERMRALADAKLVRVFPASQGIGGPVNWYKLSPEGYRIVFGQDTDLPHRGRFEAIAPSRFQHTQGLAEVIVHALVGAHRNRCAVTYFEGDGDCQIDVGSLILYPDCFLQLTLSGKRFNIYFEVDMSTESLVSHAEHSLRNKLWHYETAQEHFLEYWRGQGRIGPRPLFRVAFLTRSQERAEHIAWLASSVTRNRDRRMAYAATQDAFLAELRPLTTPLFIDHHGGWQSLVNLHPSSQCLRSPVQLRRYEFGLKTSSP